MEGEMPLKKVSQPKRSWKSSILEEKVEWSEYIEIGYCYKMKIYFVSDPAQFLHTKISTSKFIAK